ncbi:MAG: 23S rRNA (uracil(1939)-C(5))-methyltransferase RlmD, partial [Coriobacteriales bacterium]|nr:23S rRNA (uracil(1939)-C(5))-methyltransferase RlmD [Coriobacteriales bacterium]
EDHGNYSVAHIVEIIESSPVRVAPVCPFATTCGGCGWQHIAYEAQCTAKRTLVLDALERIAHVATIRTECLVASCTPAPSPLNYRNKLELGAAMDPKRGFTLGFYRAESMCIATPERCLLAHEAIVAAPRALRGALRYAQGDADLGIYRVGMRHSERSGSLELALWTEPGIVANFPRARVAQVVGDALKTTSIVRIVAAHDKMRDVRKVEVLAGRGYWEEQLGDMRFATSAPSFFQVNTAQAERLISLVMKLLSEQDSSSLENMRIVDLYAGGGTFSLPLAAAGAEVVAVESAGSSVRDLRRNAERNCLNVEIVGGDAERELSALIHCGFGDADTCGPGRSHGSPDALVVDPPRAGLTKGAVAAIVQAAPRKLVYVSCNPATWARDVARFEQAGYRLQQAHPVDLFPQTPHVEVVSLFTPQEHIA